MENNFLNQSENVNNENNAQTGKFPLWRILYRNFWLIVAITILVGVIGAGVGVLRSKTTYKAEQNVLLSVSIADGAEAKYDVSLAKLYLPTLTEVMKSSKVEKRANEIYSAEGYPGYLSVGSVVINYNDDELIFSMAYSDLSKTVCEAKLKAFIKASTEELEENGSKYFSAQEFLLTPTKSDFIITPSNNFTTYVVLGLAAGVVLSALIVFLIYFLDNKIKTSKELEDIVGVNVLAYIDRAED